MFDAQTCGHNVSIAAIAQLGERQTEDLKVPGSIPGLGMILRRWRCLIASKSRFAERCDLAARNKQNFECGGNKHVQAFFNLFKLFFFINLQGRKIAPTHAIAE